MNRFLAFALLNSRLPSHRHKSVERANALTCAVVLLSGSASAVLGWISAYHTSAAAKSYASAAAGCREFGCNSTFVELDLKDAIARSNVARHAASGQLFAETFTLVTVVFVFISGGVIAFILIKRATSLLLANSETSTPIIAVVSTGASVKLRIRRTVIAVFSGFLLRCSFNVLYSISLTADRNRYQDLPFPHCFFVTSWQVPGLLAVRPVPISALPPVQGPRPQLLRTGQCRLYQRAAQFRSCSLGNDDAPHMAPLQIHSSFLKSGEL
jgi:hypothetical protein